MNKQQIAVVSGIGLFFLIGFVWSTYRAVTVKQQNVAPTTTTQPTNSVSQVVKKVSATQFKELIEAEDSPQIVDVRTASEYNDEGHITLAKNIDYYSKSFSVEIAQLDKSKTTYVYCRSGSRSASAVALMKTMGFTTIIELENGIQSWSTAKYPLAKTLAD